MTAGKPPRAWSFSRFAQYRTCPAAYRYRIIDKLPEPPSAPMRRGLEVHGDLEKFVKGETRKLSPALAKLEPLLKAWRRGGAEAELELAFTTAWRPTGWFAADAWLRVKLDVLVPTRSAGEYPDGTLDVVDYKTGQIKPEAHAEPLELYALATFLTRPDTPAVRTFAFYVDHEPRPRQLGVFEPRHVKRLRRSWLRKVKPLIEDRRFYPTPSLAACRWCAFSKLRGGPCVAALA